MDYVNRRLGFCRVTARRATSVEILLTAAQLYKKLLRYEVTQIRKTTQNAYNVVVWSS